MKKEPQGRLRRDGGASFRLPLGESCTKRALLGFPAGEGLFCTLRTRREADGGNAVCTDFCAIRLPFHKGSHHQNAQKSGRPMVARCGCIFRFPFTGAPYFAALASAALQTGQSPCRSSVYDVIWQPVRDSIISVRSPHQMSTTLPHPSQNRCSCARTQPS